VGKNKQALKQGFTIVELLIVIVVIGILAAISVIAYNGIQANARFSAYKSDIQSINRAIQLYHADNGVYPYTGTNGCATNYSTGTGNFIPGTPSLVPNYASKIPDVVNYSGGANYYAYCWNNSGADYKIIRLVPGTTLPQNELTDNPLIDPARPTRSWGYWSPGCSSC